MFNKSRSQGIKWVNKFPIFSQSQGIKVVAIGIGSNINMAEILGMAYDSSHAFTVSSFDTLNTLQAEVKNETCVGELKE